MKRALLSMLAVAVVLGIASAALAQAPATETKTVAVVTLSSFGELKADAGALGKLIGMDDLADGLELADENGQPLIDAAKPWGLIVQVTGEGAFRQIGFVPVKNFTGLMGMVTMMVGEEGLTAPADKENGTWKVEVALADMTLFVKKQGDWAFIATSEDLLARLPADPTRVLGGLDKKYDFAAKATIKNIPKEIRDTSLGMLGMLGAMAGDPNAAAALKQSVDQITTTADQLDSLVLGLTIDAENSAIMLDVETTAIAGTTLAEQFTLAASATTNFAGFDLPGAAITGNVAASLTDNDVKGVTERITEARSTALKELRNQGLSDDELELATDLLNNVIDVFQKTVEGKKVDGGMVAMLEPGKATVAIGGGISDGAKLERIVKQLAGIASAEDEDIAKALKLDAETHKGVRFHVLSIPSPDPETTKLIGEKVTIVAAIGDKSVYAAAGSDPVGLLKQVIDKSAAEPNKKALPARLSIALTPIIKVAAGLAEEGPPKEMIAALTDALQKSAGKDHFSLVINPIPNGSITRIKIEEGVLKAIGMGAMMGMAAGGEPDFGPGGPPLE